MFGKLFEGDRFIYYNDIYIKIMPVQPINCNMPVTFNGVCLRDGKLIAIDDNEIVELYE